ncbi:hypothetical protein F5Y09DRAFT_84556 [Xylaria sp. FL1042]|nr:hypothetical protein F5Y09DRAFT_84556 [Xylaria sp. FL1042]
MASKNGVRDEVSQAPELLRPLQRRHSDSQNKADRVGIWSRFTTPAFNEEDRDRLTSDASTKTRGLAELPLVNEAAQKRSRRSRNHTDASSAAAQWVACQASFVNIHEEDVSSPKSHPTRSTQSPTNSTASIATQYSHLPVPQNLNLAGHDGLRPLTTEEIDPTSFDLVAPLEAPQPPCSLEAKAELLLSIEHLKVIFDDPNHMQNFTDFLYAIKPEAVPRFYYYLTLVKASKAIDYANAIIGELPDLKIVPSVELPPNETISKPLIDMANKVLVGLAQEDLPAYVTHVWTRIVNTTIKQRIKNASSPTLCNVSEGLAEVFCLTDPSRNDDPILFASEGFYKATQYASRSVLGRNCRFLQGPKTNQHSIRRLREMLVVGKEHCEPLLNYKRDGSAFMNLLTITPLYDNRGNIRYHLGAQVDVSRLLKEFAGLASSADLSARRRALSEGSIDNGVKEIEELPASRDILGHLADMFTLSEMKIIQAAGEAAHETHIEKHNSAACSSSRTNNKSQSDPIPIEEAPMDNSISSSALTPLTGSSLTGHVQSIIDNFLLVRPFPSLNIVFTSPSLRVPGILQSSFMSRIGGSQGIRDSIAQAFKDGDGITAKVRWLARPMFMTGGRSPNLSTSPNLAQGRGRWIHTTPLLGVHGAIGVWVVVLVDDEEKHIAPSAPPVDMFNLERQRPFDVDINNDNKSASEADAKSVSVEHDEDEVIDPGPSHRARPRSYNG